MSIFKVKEWWSNEKLQNNVPNAGIQNIDCLAVDKFIGHSESDCILVGEGRQIKIYKPNVEQDVSQTLLETELNDSVIQIGTGKFISGVEDRQIIVLHPRSYAIYHLRQKEGHTDAGEQNSLDQILNHSLNRKSYSLTYGSFGNIRSRDFICVQALDGSLSFFDQDTFLFLCTFNDIIIPTPVAYIANCDSFVISKSTWVLEVYSYQQLREFSELNLKHKKHIPQWFYNAGEEISRIQVIQSSSNFSSIVALGERHLYCFQDNGLMKYMIKFDFIPICISAYLIGWYYEPTARLLVMVASEDSKLFIYESTTLLWSCDLLYPPVSITRCYLKGLPGGLVTLSRNSKITVCYLGTEPDLNSNASLLINEPFDPQQVQEELEVVEEELQKILESEDPDHGFSLIDQIININADVGKPVQNLFQEFTKEEALHLLMCPIIVMLTCNDPKQIQSIQINYDCFSPFTCSESTVCLDGVNGTEIIETQVFLTSDADISDTRVKILFTIINPTGKIAVLTRQVLLPLSLYCKPVLEVSNNCQLKLFVKSNQSCVQFTQIFTDFTEEELTKLCGSSDVITFEYRSTKKIAKIRLSENQYIMEADNFTEITTMLDHLLLRLTDHYKRMGVKDFSFQLVYDQEFIKSLLQKFLKSIETHAKERVKLNSLEEELEVLQRQFTLVQKKLLVQYGSLPPGDCDALEFLMRDTHKRIINTVYEIIQCKETVCRAGSTLTTIGQLVIYLLKHATRDSFKIKLIEEMMSLNSIYEDHQISIITYTEKDKEKLAPVTEQGVLSQINLKRCLKQIKTILEKMFSDTRDHSEQEHVKRIEEFVEVL
ncbi:hypothetical protein O3G_MSEX006378 [Manduca sexta]|uniref:Protein PTHB1 n=1 Tax=Manduca sexta TaxID=7130 RepID=A0A921Z271_MANSE|nr:hypothetical protein O3G_MSEX006378 [Manduca sexta]